MWAEHRVGLDGGTFTVGATCAPDRADEALDALIAELSRLQRVGPTPAELDRCREVLDGDMSRLVQRVSGRAAHAAFTTLFDRPWETEVLRRERAAVGPEAVMAAMESVRAAEPIALVVRPK